MASYATATTVLTLLPGLPQTATDGSGYTETVALITKHVVRADNIIDGKVSRRYDVSAFKTSGGVPPLLITIGEDIASYYSMRSIFSGDNQNDSQWTDKFKDALAILEDIRLGNMDLVNTAGSIISERSEEVNAIVDSNMKNYQPFFDVDSVTSWSFDSDYVDEVSGNR